MFESTKDYLPAKKPKMEEIDILESEMEGFEERQRYSDLVGFIKGKFTEAQDAKRTKEDKALKALLAYRGEYNSEEKSKLERMLSRDPYASQVFIKITKTKVLAAYGQLLEVLFSDKDFPIGVSPTPVPEGVADVAHIDTSDEVPAQDIYGFKGDGMEIPKGATSKGLSSLMKSLLKGKDVKTGPSPDKNMYKQFTPAENAAYKMEKQIQDQLKESSAEFALKRLLLESCVYGTGILKGPFNYMETVNNWEQDETTKEVTYNPYTKIVPKSKQVSFWNFYPDPDAECIEDCEYVIERHLLGKSKVRDLLNMSSFNEDAIERLIRKTPMRDEEYWETIIQDTQSSLSANRYEILEYWGYVDKEIATALELDIDEDNLINIQINAWICDGEVLRLILNPFTPQRIPYYAVPYEESMHEIWGVGIPENMSDTQDLMNAHMRGLIDNLRISGNMVLEVNEQQLVPGQKMELYPGKIFRKQGGAPGQSIYGITFPNVTQAHILAFDKSRQLADEATGIPSFSHGVSGVMSTGKTAAGMSMLMGAAALNIKTVIKNIDHYLLQKLAQHYFEWNMQFNSENVEIRGDLKVIAKGTSSLMQKEVLTQRLLTFLQVGTSNPATAPMVNIEYVFKELAKNMGLDPDKVVNDPTTAKLYAELIATAGNSNGQGMGQTAPQSGQPQGLGGSGGVPSGANPNDSTGVGGGNIGVGSVPQAGEDQFSGTA